MGSVNFTDAIEIPRNGLFMMALTVLLTAAIFLMLYRSRWGLQVRATVQNRLMSRAVGINTRKVDRMTFALGCGVAGVAGAAFTTIGSTGRRRVRSTSSTPFWWWCSAARKACSAPLPRRS